MFPNKLCIPSESEIKQEVSKLVGQGSKGRTNYESDDNPEDTTNHQDFHVLFSFLSVIIL